MTGLFLSIKPVEPVKLVLTVNGTMALTSEYELLRTENGFVLSYYDGPWEFHQDTERDDCLEKRYEGDEACYAELCRLLKKIRFASWNGFNKSNPHVLDGSSFTLRCELADGRIVSAHGSNARPLGYKDLMEWLRNTLDKS